MKKTGIFTALMLIMLCIFATGCIIDDSPSKLRFSDASHVDLLIFRCGDAYLTHEKENLDWLVPYGEVPEEICLEDGEFAYVNADIARVTGGSSYYTGNPELRKVNSFQIVSFEDLVKDGEIPVYDSVQKTFHGLGYYANGKDTYCLAMHLGTYYVYENNVCTGIYHTKEDMTGALGIS